MRAAVGALLAGGMLFAGPAAIGFAAPGTNSGDNGNHGGGNNGQGNGNTGQGNGPGGKNSGGSGNPGGGNTGGGSGNPGGGNTGGGSGSFSGTSNFLICGLDDVVATSCPEDTPSRLIQ